MFQKEVENIVYLCTMKDKHVAKEKAMMKKRILFVCLGNICRSPAANGVMQRIISEAGKENEWQIDSAGIGSWHVGELPDERMRKAGERRGYVFDHRARQVCKDDFSRFDYIIGMDGENECDLRRLAPSREAARKIMSMETILAEHPTHNIVPDPFYGTTSDFELALDLIEYACDSLAKQLLIVE